MELLILGVLLGAGAARRKAVTKAVAKGYLALAETSSHMRQDLNDAISEAKADQVREAANIDLEEGDLDGAPMSDNDDLTSDYAVTVPTLTVIETFRTAGDVNDLGLDTEYKYSAIDVDDTAKDHKASRLMLKGVAKGFMKLADLTRSAATHVREDLRDAVEEAKYEREQEACKKEATVAEEVDLFDFKVVSEPEFVIEIIAEATPIAVEVPVVVKPKRASPTKAAVASNGKAHTPAGKKAPKAAADSRPTSPMVEMPANIEPDVANTIQQP